MMRRRDPFDERLLDRLTKAGKKLPARLKVELTAYEEVAVKPLATLLGTGGWGELHAVRLIHELGAKPALSALIAQLMQCDLGTYLHDEVIEALVGLGEFVVEPLLQMDAAVEDEEQRHALASVLCRTPGRRADVRTVLEEVLSDEPTLGCGLLAEYGDPAAIDSLSRVLDAQVVDRETAPPFGNQVIVEACEAIKELGGALTECQRSKLRQVDAIANARRRSISGHPIVPKARPGRNQACWCGSGRKYKHCHLSEDELAPV